MSPLVQKASKPNTSKGDGGASRAYPKLLEGSTRSNASSFSSRSPPSSSRLRPTFPYSPRTPCSKEVEDSSCSRISTSATTITGTQKPSRESLLEESSNGIPDGCEKCVFIPSPVNRRRGVQSLGTVPPRRPRLVSAQDGEQICLAETCSSFPERAWRKAQEFPSRKTKAFLPAKEEAVPEKELMPSYESSLAYRGRQYAEVQLQSRRGAPENKTPALQWLRSTFRVAFSIKERKLGLRIAVLLPVAIILFGIIVPSFFQECFLHRVYSHPLATGLSQKCSAFHYFWEVGALMLSLFSEFGGRVAPFLLQPAAEISSFTNIRLRATSVLSLIELPRSGTWFPAHWSRSSESEHSTMHAIPTVEELEKEFSQYALGRVPATEALRKHSEEFKREIIRVTEDVYVAVGFGLANCVIVNAPEGLILVDTMESTAAMAAVWRAWLELPKANKRRRTTRLTRRKHDGCQWCSDRDDRTVLAPLRRKGFTRTRRGVIPRRNKRSCASAYRTSVVREGLLGNRCSTLLCKHKKRATSNHSSRHVKQSPSVKAIIYTHFHTDHVFGAAAVVQPETEVHAHWLTYAEMRKVFTLTAGTTYKRSMRQFGVFVEKYDFLNAGIGPALRYSSREEIGTVLPTHIMYGERKLLSLAGMELELIHAPGESKDQLVVWLPEKKLLIGADNVYKSMPNIYAIRGTETRDCSSWVASLDMMRSLEPEFLVLGHTRPLTGREHIASTLLAYRDAIQFIHDQTLRYMNKGYYANDIAHMVKLPPHLSSHPFLQPFYGTVPWAVKAIFTHYMGWFSGDPEDLAVTSTQEKAETFLSLAGNVQNLLSHALKNLREGNVQRALEFAGAAHHVAPASAEARTLKILALRATAAKQQAATGRNWFLTAALELEGHAELRLSDSQKRQTLSKLSMQQVFELLPVRVVPERAADLECVLEFHFTDVEEHACVHYRRGIAFQKWPCEKTADVVVKTTREVWLGILNKDRSPALAVVTGDLHITGSLVTLVRALLSVELDVD